MLIIKKSDALSHINYCRYTVTLPSAVSSIHQYDLSYLHLSWYIIELKMYGLMLILLNHQFWYFDLWQLLVIALIENKI